ncbi:LysR family transcriptional regulator [Thalassospira sp. MA62]|nr:LysR family transcriptional regulator [Thalassospira sp. MA62]
MIQHENQFSGVVEFVESVRQGTFTAAGAQIGLTGSAVGKSVTRLEQRLGTKLLHRTTRRLSLTQEGQSFYEAWVTILDQVKDLENSLLAGSALVAGTLRVNLPAAFGRRHVMPVLSGLARKYPMLHLVVNFTERRSNLIDEGIDLVVRIGALEDDADLMARKLGRQRLLICASPDYLKANGTPAEPDDLIRHDCIYGPRNRGHAAWLFSNPDGRRFSHAIQPRFELSDGEAMLDAALAGCGVAQLPAWLIHEHVKTGRLVTVLDRFVGAEMPIHVVWPRSRFLQPRQRAAIDALVAAAAAPDSVFQL